MKKKIIRLVAILVLVFLTYGSIYLWKALPLISGYGAKMLCSCVFISNRNPEDVVKKELGKMPIALGSFSINRKDSAARGNVLGLATKKAIFRKGLGCTLVNEFSETEIRSQRYYIDIPPKNNQDSVSWPLGNFLSDPLPEKINHVKLENIIEEAFKESGKNILRQTRAIIIVYKGKIIAEKYAEGFNDKTVQVGWSMTKSIMNALIGILVKQGKLNVNNPVALDEWKNDERKNITLDQLMHANSGLKWEENYAGPSPVTNMLYKKGNMAKSAIEYKLKYAPGTFFQYSSGTSNILSYIIRKNMSDENYYEFPYQELFYKTGMYSAVIEPDASGTYVGSSYCSATARDWARFGLLYLNDGVLNGERILPEGWIKYTTTPSRGATRGQYGAQFWLNAGAPEDRNNRYYPDVPTDCFWADGYQGQDVWIIPSKKLVVVRLSLQQGSKLDENKFLAGIIEAITTSE